jgi:hypothetical protein
MLCIPVMIFVCFSVCCISVCLVVFRHDAISSVLTYLPNAVVCLSDCTPIVYLSFCLYAYLYVCLSVCLSACTFAYHSLSVFPFVCLYVCQSSRFSISHSELNESLVIGGGFFFVLYSALLHLPPLRFHCADRCWDRTQDRCNRCIDSQTF